MSSYFKDAFLSDNEIFNFKGASSRVSSNNPNDQNPRRTTVKDAEFSEVLSNNNNSLFYNSMSSFVIDSNNKEAREYKDIGSRVDQYSQKINYSSSNYKL